MVSLATQAAGQREAVGNLVRDDLTVCGLRVVVTSRPEGVVIEDYLSRFVCVDLKPLSSEQQRNAVSLTGSNRCPIS